MRFGINNKLIILSLFLFCLVNLACGQSQQERNRLHNEYTDKATELREQGDLREAVEYQKKAVEILPENGKPLMVLANLYLELYEKNRSKQDLEEAKKALEKAIKLNPNDPIGHEMLGETFKRLGKNDEAIKQLRMVLKIHPDDIDSLVNIGAIYTSSGRYKLAEETFENVLKKNPNYIYALFHYGDLEAKRGNIEKAKTLLIKAVAQKEIASSDDFEFVEQSEKKLEEIENQKSKSAKISN